MTAFIGPSGCGKSTFLRTLNRMHEVIPKAYVKGEVLLDGDDLYGPGVDPVRVRASGRHGVPATQPVPHHVDRRQRAGRREAEQPADVRGKAKELLEGSLRGANLWNEVKDRLDKPGSGLSGGQQQRLCIARAIAVQPEVILMDEPCSALDPISTLAIEDLIGELKENYTVVIVTHNMQQAARVSDKTAFFNLAAQGKPGKLIEMRRPPTRSSPTRTRRPPRTTSAAASDRRPCPSVAPCRPCFEALKRAPAEQSMGAESRER